MNIYGRYAIALAVLALCLCARSLPAAEPEAPLFRFEEGVADDPVSEQLEKGRIAVAERMYGSAIKYLEGCAKSIGAEDPRYSQVIEMLAKAYIGNGEPQKAVDAIDARDRLPGARPVPALVYGKGQALVMLGKWSEAYSHVISLNAAGIDPGLRRDAIVLCSDCLMKQKNWNGIAELVSGYIASDPEHANVYPIKYRLAEAQIARGDYEAAEETIGGLKSSAKDRLDELKYNLIHIRNLALLKKTGPAMSEFAEVESRMPERPDNDWWLMLTALGDALYEDKDYDNSLRCYEMAGRMSDSDSRRMHAMDYIVRIHIDRADDEEVSRRALDDFARLFPGSRELMNLMDAMARMLGDTGRLESAASLFERLAALNPPGEMLYQAFLNAGICWEKLGSLDRSINAFLKAAEKGRNDHEKADALYQAASVESQLLRDNGADFERRLESTAARFKLIADTYPKDALAATSRFRQAETLALGERFKDAAAVYGQFANAYPEDAHFEMALLQMGVNLRKGAVDTREKLAAADNLDGSMQRMSNADLVARVRIEAFRACDEGGDRSRAEKELGPVIANEAVRPELRKLALFSRAVLFFDMGREKASEARADLKLFSELYTEDRLVDQLYMYNGDSYGYEGDWTSALSFYIRPVNKTHDEAIQPFALYEAANASYHLDRTANALEYVDRLIDGFKAREVTLGDDERQVMTRAFYLKGDIQSCSSDYDGAIASYSRCAELSRSPEQICAARGRCGEMYLMKAQRSKVNLQDDRETGGYFDSARQCFEQVIREFDSVSHPLGLRSKYYLALSFKLQKKDMDAALDAYKDFYLSYSNLKRKANTPDDFFFANAIFDMAEIYEERGDLESLNEAKNYYEKLSARYDRYLAERGRASRPARAVDMLDAAGTAEKRISALNLRIRELSGRK